MLAREPQLSHTPFPLFSCPHGVGTVESPQKARIHMPTPTICPPDGEERAGERGGFAEGGAWAKTLPTFNPFLIVSKRPSNNPKALAMAGLIAGAAVEQPFC